MKRFIVDCASNYLFFVPLVIAFTPVLWTMEGVLSYMRAAVPITLIGASLYTRFLMWAYRRTGVSP